MDNTERYAHTHQVESTQFREDGMPRHSMPPASMWERDRYNTHHIWINRAGEALNERSYGNQMTGGPVPFTHLSLEPRNFPQLFNTEYRTHFVNQPELNRISYAQSPSWLTSDKKAWGGSKPFWMFN